MVNPPSGASLLFGALADSGRIKQRKNGSYRMVLRGVEEIDWFTDRPYRYEGLWKPQKLIRRWGRYFATSEPNAQAAVKVGEDRHLMTFEMLKPRYNPGSKRMIFKINASIINQREDHLIDELFGQKLTDVSLFIDDATTTTCGEDAFWDDLHSRVGDSGGERFDEFCAEFRKTWRSDAASMGVASPVLDALLMAGGGVIARIVKEEALPVFLVVLEVDVKGDGYSTDRFLKI